MATPAVSQLLSPPNTQASILNAVSHLNAGIHDVQNARNHHRELEEKLAVSLSERDTLLAQTKAKAQEYLVQAKELSLLRYTLTDELSDLNGKLVSSMGDATSSSTLLEDIETLHRSLHELQSVKAYVQIIHYALLLSEKAVADVNAALSAHRTVDTETIRSYSTLDEYIAKVVSTLDEANDIESPLQILVFLQDLRTKTWSDIKSALTRDLVTTSDLIGWPMQVKYDSSTLDKFAYSFRNLLILQTLPHQNSEPADGLYAIQALTQPVSARFKYHFDGTRETNRLDKPEWYFTNILNVLHEQRNFLDGTVQKLLKSSEFKHINAWNEFALSVFPILSRKLKKTIPSLFNRPSLLAHTIYQTLSFDASVLESGFDIGQTTAASTKWNGISDVILGKKEWFQVWIDAETEFAETQYNDIVSAPDAWLFSDEEQDDSLALRSTNSARRLKALIEQITDRYSPLPQFPHRTRFLISVQLPILEAYLSRVGSSLDAFENLSFAFVRAVPGALTNVALGGGSGPEVNVKMDAERLTSGVEGVQRLGKALVSARFIEAALQGWGEELFFLELWAEINRKSALRNRAEAHPSLPDPTSTEDDVPEDTIFHELVAKFKGVAERSEEMIVQQSCGEVERGLRAHLSGPLPEQDNISLSPTLLPSVALLSSLLTNIRSIFSEITTFTLYRKIASRLAEHILHRQILFRGRSRLTAYHGQIIATEADLWVDTSRNALAAAGEIGQSRLIGPWGRLLQGTRLVALHGEAWTEVVSALITTPSPTWQEVVERHTSYNELSHEEVLRALATREDCPKR